MDPAVTLAALHQAVVTREPHLASYFRQCGQTHLAMTDEGLSLLDHLLPSLAIALEEA
jgi:hypothetical protein